MISKAWFLRRRKHKRKHKHMLKVKRTSTSTSSNARKRKNSDSPFGTCVYGFVKAVFTVIYKLLCLLVPVPLSLVKTRLNIISILYLMIDIKVIRFVDYISPLIFKIKMGSYISFYCLIAWCSGTPPKVKAAQLFKFHIIFITLQFFLSSV